MKHEWKAPTDHWFKHDHWNINNLSMLKHWYNGTSMLYHAIPKTSVIFEELLQCSIRIYQCYTVDFNKRVICQDIQNY
jgi:hypothetical protein